MKSRPSPAFPGRSDASGGRASPLVDPVRACSYVMTSSNRAYLSTRGFLRWRPSLGAPHSSRQGWVRQVDLSPHFLFALPQSTFCDQHVLLAKEAERRIRRTGTCRNIRRRNRGNGRGFPPAGRPSRHDLQSVAFSYSSGSRNTRVDIESRRSPRSAAGRIGGHLRQDSRGFPPFEVESFATSAPARIPDSSTASAKATAVTSVLRACVGLTGTQKEEGTS
jgi:hypothetical protein